MEQGYQFVHIMDQSDPNQNEESTHLTDISGAYRYQEQPSTSLDIQDEVDVSLRELLQLWGVGDLENYFIGKLFIIICH